MSEWKQPELRVGDQVYFYDNPTNPQNPVMGWVVEPPGTQTISVLVFSQSAGFVEKKSVRHKDDPFWRESEVAQQWQKWGAYELHPVTELLPMLSQMIADWKIAKAKRADVRSK